MALPTFYSPYVLCIRMYSLILSVIVLIAVLSFLSEIIVADGDVTADVIIVCDNNQSDMRREERPREIQRERQRSIENEKDEKERHTDKDTERGR